MPITVGRANAAAVILKFFVSLYTVRHDVAHGKRNKNAAKRHKTVHIVHPFEIRSERNASRLSY